MNVAVTAACFLAAVLTTLLRGAGSALAFVYFPALLLLSMAESVYLPGLPDVTPPTACIYGILIGGLLGGRRPRLRISSVDCLVVFLLFAYVVSAVRTEGLDMGLNVFGSMALTLVLPYFIVRCTLEQKRTQRETLYVCVAAIAIIAFFALIEVRVWPTYFLRLLGSLGIGEFTQGFAYRRFGFFRSNSSFGHPIDLGISAALVLAAIFILANRSGVGTRNAWVRLGLGMALVAALASLSFTPIAGFAGALCLYLALSTVPSARRYLTPGVAIVIALGFAYMADVASEPLTERPFDESAFVRSRWTRHQVIKRGWEAAATAGAFGLGASVELREMFHLKSVDNAYLLIAIQRGWVALGLWLALPLCLAAMVSRALRREQSRSVRRSIHAGCSASIGTMIAMATVWFGFTYQSLLMVMIALTVNAAQAATPARRTSRGSRSSPRAASRGPKSRSRRLVFDKAERPP